MENKLNVSLRLTLALNVRHNRAGWRPRIMLSRRPLWGRALPVVTGRCGAERGEPLRLRELLRVAS